MQAPAILQRICQRLGFHQGTPDLILDVVPEPGQRLVPPILRTQMTRGARDAYSQIDPCFYSGELIEPNIVDMYAARIQGEPYERFIKSLDPDSDIGRIERELYSLCKLYPTAEGDQGKLIVDAMTQGARSILREYSRNNLKFSEAERVYHAASTWARELETDMATRTDVQIPILHNQAFFYMSASDEFPILPEQQKRRYLLGAEAHLELAEVYDARADEGLSWIKGSGGYYGAAGLLLLLAGEEEASVESYRLMADRYSLDTFVNRDTFAYHIDRLGPFFRRSKDPDFYFSLLDQLEADLVKIPKLQEVIKYTRRYWGEHMIRVNKEKVKAGNALAITLGSHIEEIAFYQTVTGQQVHAVLTYAKMMNRVQRSPQRTILFEKALRRLGEHMEKSGDYRFGLHLLNKGIDPYFINSPGLRAIAENYNMAWLRATRAANSPAS